MNPTPNCDCKLNPQIGDLYISDINITTIGLPSAIACNLIAAINVIGIAVPVTGDTNGEKPQIGSDPTQSTNDQGRSFIAPPPRTPFEPLAQANHVCIAHYNNQQFRLPPGSYHKQSRLGFEISNADSLTLPPGGWCLATHWKHMRQPHERGPYQYTDWTYSNDQDLNKQLTELTAFKYDMSAIHQDLDGEALFTISGPFDGSGPICCLFTEPKFGGNVWCMGIGGGDVLPQWKDMAQSVSCHGGGQAWLYAKEYGDAGSVWINGNVENLANEPYGDGKVTFSKNVKALCVLKAKD